MFTYCRLFAALLASFLPSLAQAQPPGRLWVEPIRGPEGASLRAALISSLQASAQVVDAKEWEQAKRRLRIRGGPLRAKDLRRLSHELQVAAVLSGSVRRSGRQWALSVRVRSAASGEAVGSAVWSGRTLANLRAVRNSGADRLTKALAQTRIAPAEKAAPVVAATPSVVSAPPPAAAVVAAPAFVDPAAATAWYAQADPQALSAEAAPRDPARSTSSPEDRWEAFVIAADVGVLFRTIKAEAGVFERYRNTTLATNNNAIVREQRRYRSNAPGNLDLGFRLELYPGAFGKRQAFPWLGVVVAYHQAIGLGLSAAPCTQMGCPTAPVAVDAAASEVYTGLRFRTRFRDRPHAARLFVDAGWNQLSFVLEPDDLTQIDRSTVVPPFVYQGLQLSGGITVSAVPTYLLFSFYAGARIGLALGADARRIWGTRSKAGQGFLGGIEIRSEAPYLWRGAFMSLNAQFFGYLANMRGQTACRQGDCSNLNTNTPELWEPWPYDGTPENLLPGGGIDGKVKDFYLRWNFSFGYAFR